MVFFNETKKTETECCIQPFNVLVYISYPYASTKKVYMTKKWKLSSGNSFKSMTANLLETRCQSAT